MEQQDPIKTENSRRPTRRYTPQLPRFNTVKERGFTLQQYMFVRQGRVGTLPPKV